MPDRASLPDAAAGASATPASILAEGIQALDLDIPASRQTTLLRYVDLLAKWNRVYSLTSVRDPREMVIRHLLDSLATLPWLRGPDLLDFGTGPGLPGLVLAVARPAWRLTLLDRSAKKLRFVHQATNELQINNVEIVETRIEAYRPAQQFATVITRAFGTLGEIAGLGQRFCAPGGVLAAMKGGYPEAELSAVPDTLRVSDIHRLEVPGLHADRHLVIMQARI